MKTRFPQTHKFTEQVLGAWNNMLLSGNQTGFSLILSSHTTKVRIKAECLDTTCLEQLCQAATEQNLQLKVNYHDNPYALIGDNWTGYFKTIEDVGTHLGIEVTQQKPQLNLILVNEVGSEMYRIVLSSHADICIQYAIDSLLGYAKDIARYFIPENLPYNDK